MPRHTCIGHAGSARLDYLLCGNDDFALLHAISAQHQPHLPTPMTHAHHSDHLPLMVQVPYEALFDAPLPAPPTPPPPPVDSYQRSPTFLRPFSTHDLQRFTRRTEVELGVAATALAHRINSTVDKGGQVRPRHRDNMIREAQQCITDAFEIALQTLPTKMLPPQHTSRPPTGQPSFFSRSRKRQHDHHLQRLLACRKMLRLLARTKRGIIAPQAVHQEEILSAARALPPHLRPPSEHMEEVYIATYKTTLFTAVAEHRDDIRRVLKDHFTAHKRKLQQKLEHTWRHHRRLATQHIFGAENNTGVAHHSMPAMQHPTLGLVCDPALILEAVSFYHHNQMQPKVTQHDAGDLPWERADALDAYQTQASGHPTGQPSPQT
jgi:hypothetical protein